MTTGSASHGSGTTDDGAPAVVVVPEQALRIFLTPRHRSVPLRLPVDPASTVGHLVESAGIPRTEVGGLTLDDEPVAWTSRTDTPGRLVVRSVTRPQACPTDPPRFLLDVHLGSLARRLWLLGLDVSYGNNAADDDLITQSVAEQRVLLTQDRGLLSRKVLHHGAYVRGSSVEDQTDDVLDRFAPQLSPWTRCGACGGVLEEVDRADVDHLLHAGTRRTYADFARCCGCGRPFWRGAHAGRLDASVRRARRVVAGRASGASTGGSQPEE